MNCPICNRDLDIEAFPLRGDTGRRRPFCRDCYLETRRSRWVETATSTNEKRRNRHATNPQTRERVRQAGRRYRARNLEKSREASRQSHKARRERVLTKYGGKCACCGEWRIPFLAVDHVHGGGTRERKRLNVTGVYRKLDAMDRSPEYRILCHNCNMAYAYCGTCPHLE